MDCGLRPSCMWQQVIVKTLNLNVILLNRIMKANNLFPPTGDSPRGLEAAEVLRHHRGHGDSSSHHAGGDRTVGSVHPVQHPEEVYDRGRVPQAGQQQKVSRVQRPHL